MVRARGFCRSIGMLVVLWGILTAGRAQGFAGGTGEPNAPYQIASAEQLASIGSDENLLSKHYVLLNDIDLDPNLPGGKVFARAVIAPNTDDASDLFQGIPFSGRFDGKGHAITNLTIRGGGRAFLGLFGSVGGGGQVRNLRVKDAVVVGKQSCRCLGVLAGYVEQCAIVNCSVTGRVTGSDSARSLGGLVGFVWYDGRIIRCAASCDVSAGDRSTGLGGFAGDHGGEIVDCCARGTLSSGPGSADLGGLVGRNSPLPFDPKWYGASSLGSIIHCYAVVWAVRDPTSEEPGGLVGRKDKYNPGLINGFWDMEASGLLTSAGGLGLSTSQLHDRGTYIAAGWDFVGERANGTADPWLMPEAGEYAVLTTVSDAPAAHELAGEGTADDPYRIVAAEDLGAVWHHDASACYRLMRDVDLSGMSWSIAPICVFNGRLDGAGFAVLNLEVHGQSYLGLFDSLGPQASITNLRILNAQVGDRGSREVAVLAGRNEGLISGCQVQGSVTGDDCIAMLVGLNERRGVITDCHVMGIVSGTGKLHDIGGGLAGISAGNITNSHASVELTAGDWDTLGGLVGLNSGEISGCYATGRIAGNDFLGGLVGANQGTVSNSYASVDIRCQHMNVCMGGLVGVNEAKVVNCYSVSMIRDRFNTPPLGGLIGWQPYAKGVAVNAFWDQQTTGIVESWGGGAGLTTVQMRMADTFLNAGWDFDKTWMICEGKDYPRLQWERVQCQP
jgi:hypothetical protein